MSKNKSSETSGPHTLRDLDAENAQASRNEILAELSRTAAELEYLRTTSKESQHLFYELAEARDKPWESLKHKQVSKFLYWLARQESLFSERRRERFLSSAKKRDPKRSIHHLVEMGALESSDGGGSFARTKNQDSPSRGSTLAKVTNRKHDSTVMVVSHDATRTGAPILALNLVKELGKNHNVISVTLGGGELANEFRAESVEFFELNRRSIKQAEITKRIVEICAKNGVRAGFVNSVESRSTLPGLRAAGIPSVALLHEFATYIRPTTAFSDVLVNADHVVFSADITLDNVLSELGVERPVNVHILPQGKCSSQSADEAPNKIETAWLDSVLRPGGAADETFVVIGAGTIETRKGIDLFVEVANRVIRGPGGGRFRFVWFGHGYDPVLDTQRSAYLADQIERAGIQSQVQIVRSTTEIEHVYKTADLLLLSSRLDPLPNVAIDMLVANKPMVCFERTTGIADLLESAGLKEACIASFLDTTEMAEKIVALAHDADLLADVLARSQKLARETFDFAAYTHRLENLVVRGGCKSENIIRDAKRLKTSGAFRQDFFSNPLKEKTTEDQDIKNYLNSNVSGAPSRKPVPGFNPLIYAEEHGWKLSNDPFISYIDEGCPEGRWKSEVINETSGIDPDVLRTTKVALHIHAFFPDEVGNILTRLSANQVKPSLFVSAPQSQLELVKDVISPYNEQVVALRAVPNRGRDIAPFLTEFGQEMAADFDIIGHLHTKKSGDVQDRKVVANWVEFLMQNTVGGKIDPTMLDRIVTTMAKQPEVGIVYPDDPNLLGWAKNKAIAGHIAQRLGITKLPQHINYPMGTMFWARADLIERFLELNLGWNDYPAEPLPYDGSSLHAIERLFGVAPASFGYRTGVTNVRGLTR
ncbi:MULTISPECIES: rhamnan synthesis F family protein [unclassified Ruegeria]|uniref:rhamnan synthesis F family protein n=1 Tax=unclassified Ruegeria TaxID=2625375 RepID=UPI001AE7C544|nr:MULTISPECIES: rhamnan synthesis F family protein [unclassified Ruegeria]